MQELIGLLQTNSLTMLLLAVLIFVLAKYIGRIDKFIDAQTEINNEFKLITKVHEKELARLGGDVDDLKDDVDELKPQYIVKYKKDGRV